MSDRSPRPVPRDAVARRVDIVAPQIASFLAVLLVTLLAPGLGDRSGPIARADEAQHEHVVEGPVTFEVEEGGRLEVNRDRRYLDTVELLPRGDGAVLVNELSIDDYVAGIAEVPASWPMEALKAQAVAARTYGWYVMRRATYDGYDICATVSCQVFRGADVVLGSDHGDRWREAVDDTAGEVLVDDAGDPVLARYFSTSGGRTYANEEVFPSSGDHDHLVSIDDPYDAVSPYHRWTVRFTRDEFDTLAARGDQLSGIVPVASAERIGDVADPRATIRVTGEEGAEVEVTAGQFRDFLSRVAPDSFPDRFPPLRDDGLGTLPSTVPTARYDIEVTDDEVVLHGQGWGHGVGLGQYGARGRAEEGASYLDILAAYYNGLAPQASDQVPDRVRVGIDAGSELTIRGDAPVRILTGDEELEPAALGTWTVAREGTGWRLTPPEGHGAPLEVTPTEITKGLRTVTDAVTVEAEVNKPVRLSMEVTDDAGDVVVERDLGVVDAGRHAAVWRLEDAQGSLVSSGDYRISLIGADHAGERDGTAVDVALPLASDDDGSPFDRITDPASRTPLAIAAVVAGLLLLAVAAFVVIRRNR
jgi:SpoIID/LytB domain protein